MRAVLLAAAAMLTGCATPPPPGPPILTSEIAARMPIANLCLGVSTFGPTSSGVARAEIERRGVDCREHAQAVGILQQQQLQAQAQAQAAGQAAAMGLMLQNMSRPAYQIPPPPGTGPQTNCTSRWVYGTLQTTCN